MATALEVIRTTSPDSRILMVGQLGRPDPAYVETLVAADPAVKASLTGTGPCDFFNPAGELVEENFATLTRIIESYEVRAAVSRAGGEILFGGHADNQIDGRLRE